MSTITVIQPDDLITNSRADLNNNFANLNSGKIETSVLDTDTTLAANSDAKIATQKAVKAYVDSIRNTVIATGLTTGLTVIPKPQKPIQYGGNRNNFYQDNYGIDTNTKMCLGLVNFPIGMVANKVSLMTETVTTGGTFKIALYSEDGQNLIFSVDATAAASSTLVTTTLSSVTILPGNYYFALVPVGTTNFTTWGYYSNAFTVFDIVSGKTKFEGTLTVSPGTTPSTITPTNITWVADSTFVVRFDK